MKNNSHLKEEKVNALSHALGIVLGIVGFYLLLVNDTHKSEYSTQVIIIYSVSIIMLYLASTAYHICENQELKRNLRILDHICIYFLIAGTYSPVSLIALINGNGWTIFYIIWGIAILGTIYKLFFTGKYMYISLILYIGMGWLIVFDIDSLWSFLSLTGKILFLLGGVFYTLGTYFYVNDNKRYYHLIWHLFVLAGSISHWFLIYLEII